jgi:thymidylate synthase ThyX
MKTSAIIIADSFNGLSRLTTFQVCFPRFILAEVNTHRVLSRNYRSSRAVPVSRLIEEVSADPFIPHAFTRNKPGMQGGDPLEEEESLRAETRWRQAAIQAAHAAASLAELGVHKQYANRMLEPFAYVHGVISGTEWDNFFKLRCHPDAQPEFHELAVLMRNQMIVNKPKKLIGNEWHPPYISDEEAGMYNQRMLLALSAARCAWVSYKPFDESQRSDVEKAINTVKKLSGDPMHASPFEHQAIARPSCGSGLPSPKFFPSNFNSEWVQARHLIENGVIKL